MKDHTQALTALQKATDSDKDRTSTREINEWNTKIQHALYSERSNETDEQTLERAMRDPEVAAIMSDPIMQSILQQAQNDPAALQNHMRNEGIQKKIFKLVEAGIIKTR